MASSENLASIEPWLFRTNFADSWFSETYARDTETLTKALQKSMSDNTNTSNNSGTLTSDSISQFFGGVMKPEATPTASNVSGSEQETAPKWQRSAIPVSRTGTKATKRKSRASSKRSQTTFITADPANFRQMVQQVTGVKFGSSQMSMAPVLKPEPQRPSGRLVGAGGFLPTLDTSAFLLDRHQQQGAVGPTAGIGPVIGSGPLSYAPTMGLADGSGATGLEFDTFPSFPTLESWKVM
ncbi:hypothetical protein HS088_TW13G00493 [Tripterygium wilfordii]|uniref:VQ domain-containing protein n=1 Tax=Tripterygium wilfordii TaxID=458696 RepID=A0A7J7CU39_TRIWF|nr:calmodulin-binding protein 25-like [Tripterygium wilfordii]KAF5737607.1 hypothetical protein HS088_TW13G00493 [Tripterygium wilfordii]